MIVFSEDRLLDVICRKLFAELRPDIVLGSSMGGKGHTYLQACLASIIRSSQGIPFAIMVDADFLRGRCPGDQIVEWFGRHKPLNILIRFAAHEAESWLLADRNGIADFLKISRDSVPIVGDETINTKELLVNLASRSRSRIIKDEMVPKPNFSAKVGPAYNENLTAFVRNSWNISDARQNNSSLERACIDIENFAIPAYPLAM